MRKSTLPLLAGLFSTAILALTALGAQAAPQIAGTYAAVTPQSVELLTLAGGRSSTIHGSYRVLHLNPVQAQGLDDQSVAVSSIGAPADSAFALQDARTLVLRFDKNFSHAQATVPSQPGSTQSLSRVTPEQVRLLVEMARYGGLYEVCSAHRNATDASPYSQAFCRNMGPQLADIVPFRPFPDAGAKRPVLAYAFKARLSGTLAINK